MAPHVARQGTEQVLPTWLTYSPIVLPSGGTSYTILRLPLTYYGPSIPLGTDGIWTYGGLSSPAPSATPSITASSAPPVTTSPPTTTSPSTSALPSSTSLSSSTSASSSTSSATQPTTTSFATPITSRRPTSTSSTPSATSTSPAGQSPHLPILAIILIALGAAAAVLLCCLIGALLWRRRKARREPPRGDSEFYAGPDPQDDESVDSVHVVPALTGERDSLLGNDSFVVVNDGGRRLMQQRSMGGVSYQRLGGSRAPSHHSSRRTGSDEIGVAYTELPPPRRRRTVTAVSNAQSSSPSHPTSSSQRAIGSMLNISQRSSLFERPAEQDESPVLPRDSAHGVVRRASDLDERPLQPPPPAASPYAHGATLGTELGFLGLGTRYPDPSQSLLATSSSGGSIPPRLVVPTLSSLGSRSRTNMDTSRPVSHAFAGSQPGSRASRGHSPTPSNLPGSLPTRDTLMWPDSPESEHDENTELLVADRENVRSGVGLLGRFSWFARGTSRPTSSPIRTSRASYPGWMSPPTEEGFLAEVDSELEAGPSDPPTLESKPPVSFPGMVRLVTSRDREQPPMPQSDSNTQRPVSSVSGQSVYHDASSQPATPRSQVSTWLGFLGRASPAAGPAPPVPARPSPLSHTSGSTQLAGPPQVSITPPQAARTRGSSDSEVDPASRLVRDDAQPATDRSGSEADILDAPAPESLLDVPPPSAIPPSPATPSNAPVFPPGLTRLPRTWNFGLLNELGDEPPAAEERWANLRSSPNLNWDLRRFSLGQTVRINSPHAVTDSQVASVHGGTNSRSGHSHSPSSSPSRPRPVSEVSTRSRYSQTGGTMYSELRSPAETEPEAQASPTSRRAIDRTLGNAPSMSAMTSGTAPDTNTVSSNTPCPPETMVTESESGRFGFDFGLGAFGFGDDSEGYDDYETRATTVSSGRSGNSSGHEAVDLHAERNSGQDFGWLSGLLRAPPMSAVGQSGWGEQPDADMGRV